MCYAEVTEAQIQKCLNRLTEISNISSSLSKISTGDAAIDDLKNSTVQLCQEVSATGNDLMTIYNKRKNGEKVTSELIETSAKLVEEGKLAAEVGKKIEPATKALKNIKNFKTILNAKDIISQSSSAVSKITEEIADEKQILDTLLSAVK